MWFRQNLRQRDNPVLKAAGDTGVILPEYIHDKATAGELELGGALRGGSHHSQTRVNETFGGGLRVWFGDPRAEQARLYERIPAARVVWNGCYEPWRIAQDGGIARVSLQDGIETEPFSGKLLWEPWEAVKSDGSPYEVITPLYWNLHRLARADWLARNWFARRGAEGVVRQRIGTGQDVGGCARLPRRQFGRRPLAAALHQAPSIRHMCATPYDEVGVCWEDIDPDATGMKRKRTHRVPLSNHAVAVLREAWPRQDGWVFSLPGDGPPLCRDLRSRPVQVAQHRPILRIRKLTCGQTLQFGTRIGESCCGTRTQSFLP